MSQPKLAPVHPGEILLEEFLAQYEFAVDKAVYYPGAYDTLLALKASGFKLGLCTNKPEMPARAVMRHMRMEPIFDVLMAGGMIASRKPEPAMLLQTIKSLGGGQHPIRSQYAGVIGHITLCCVGIRCAFSSEVQAIIMGQGRQSGQYLIPFFISRHSASFSPFLRFFQSPTPVSNFVSRVKGGLGVKTLLRCNYSRA